MNGVCTRQTSTNTNVRRCRLLRNYGKPIRFGANANLNSRTFTRTVGGRVLKAGNFVAEISVVDSDGVRSNTAVAAFRIR